MIPPLTLVELARQQRGRVHTTLVEMILQQRAKEWKAFRQAEDHMFEHPRPYKWVLIGGEWVPK